MLCVVLEHMHACMVWRTSAKLDRLGSYVPYTNKNKCVLPRVVLLGCLQDTHTQYNVHMLLYSYFVQGPKSIFASACFDNDLVLIQVDRGPMIKCKLLSANGRKVLFKNEILQEIIYVSYLAKKA